jgi:hypothetical protein
MGSIRSQTDNAVILLGKSGWIRFLGIEKAEINRAAPLLSRIQADSIVNHIAIEFNVTILQSLLVISSVYRCCRVCHVVEVAEEGAVG